MKKILLSVVTTIIGFASLLAETKTITLQKTESDVAKEYTLNELIVREEGPGILYRRIRIPDYPLNINLLEVDMDNPYNRIETMQAYETLYRTEKLSNAYTRYTTPEKRPIAGANANFWCVATQPPFSDLLIGATYNGNLRNGKIITETNGHADQWDGGPTRTGVIAVDTDKNLYCGKMFFKCVVSNEKIGSPEVYTVNKTVRDGEIGLYNSYFGTKNFMPVDVYTEGTTQHFKLLNEGVATEVYLTVNDDQRWLAGRDMVCTVQEVKENAGRGTLGSCDLCLVGRGDNKDLLAKLSAGDQVTINYGWTTEDGTKTPEIEQLIGGNAYVMLDGEMTTRNDDEKYNYQIYSRTGYGMSADGRTLYIIVIDKSTDHTYGTSAGCNTRIMCQIAKYYGCSNLVNFDAGGSAEMMLHGDVINTTTESSPRAVANGWFIYSTAPVDDVVTKMIFADDVLQAPIYSSYSPRIIAYNQYGDIISHDLQGFTLSCDPELGTCDEMTFTAGGNIMTGKLTATYNGVTVTQDMNVLGGNLSIRIKPTIVIDAKREYPMEVTATVGDNVFTYDPAVITWTVEDPTIASVDENGILRGLKVGKTKITGKIGDFIDETMVSVEIADAPCLYHTDFSTWLVSNGTNVQSGSLNGDGVMSFKYNATQRAYGAFTLNSNEILYSLPDRLWIEFTSTVPIYRIMVKLDGGYNGSKTVSLSSISGVEFAVNEKHLMEIPISELGDLSDLINYPIGILSMTVSLQKGTKYAGEHTFAITDLYAEYDNYISGIESVSISKDADKIKIFPNPVTEGNFMVMSPEIIEEIHIYTLSGTEIVSTDGADITSTVDVSSLTPGIYLVKVITANNHKISKLIIK